MTEKDSAKGVGRSRGPGRARVTSRPGLRAVTRRHVFLVLCGLLACALGVAAVVTVLDAQHAEARRANDVPQRNEVRRVASAFAANLNTYSPQQVDSRAYRDRIEPLLTRSFRNSFDRALSDLVQQMKAQQVTSKGKVLATGVSSIDRDSAVVLVVADADVTTKGGDRVRHFRWRVDLVHRAGEWLVDGFQPQA